VSLRKQTYLGVASKSQQTVDPRGRISPRPPQDLQLSRSGAGISMEWRSRDTPDRAHLIPIPRNLPHDPRRSQQTQPAPLRQIREWLER